MPIIVIPYVASLLIGNSKVNILIWHYDQLQVQGLIIFHFLSTVKLLLQN